MGPVHWVYDLDFDPWPLGDAKDLQVNALICPLDDAYPPLQSGPVGNEKQRDWLEVDITRSPKVLFYCFFFGGRVPLLK